MRSQFASKYKPFFSASQMSHLMNLASSSLTEDITINRKSVVSSDYGDYDEVTYTPVVRTKGWLFSTPTPQAEIDSGSLITSNTYRLFVPVGTDIKPHDLVKHGNDEYIVTDTTYETTWQALTVCSLRKRE